MSDKDKLTDSQVISLIIKGDIDMYSVIIERYENKLLRYAMFISKDYDTAADIVQESFIKAYINLQNFNQTKQFSPWIYRILHNEAMNVIKRNKKTVDLDIIDEKNINLKTDFDTADIIDRKILKSGLCNCLKKLKVKYREAVILYYFEHLKYDEISEILRIPTSTVGVRINRGKQMLKEICEQDGVKYEQ